MADSWLKDRYIDDFDGRVYYILPPKRSVFEEAQDLFHPPRNLPGPEDREVMEGPLGFVILAAFLLMLSIGLLSEYGPELCKPFDLYYGTCKVKHKLPHL